MLSTTILAATDAGPSPVLAVLQWLLLPGGFALVVGPLVAQWLTNVIQTRAPRARVAAIKTAVETLALLEAGSETYRAVEEQMHAEARALAAADHPADEPDAPSPAARAEGVDLTPTRADHTRYRRNRRAAWLTGAGGVLGATVMVLGFIESARTGEPSTTSIVGSIIFVVGFSCSLGFGASAHAIRDVKLRGRSS